ncbi:holin [Stecheria intestinalis]|uniref:holin n=1 Tax=Stecheria intestinalis TaxID=2606630 RepID=UPI0023F0204D|nr:holin [Stecheria intestinalis]MDD5880993.1 holin [Stecheria intestinalis]
MNAVFTKEWWHAAAVRAFKTMAQCAVAMLPAAATISAVDWQTVAGTAALSGVVSLLTSIAGLPEVQTTEKDNASED